MTTAKTRGRHTLEREPARIKVERLLSELAQRSMSMPEIMAVLCVTKNTAGLYAKVLKEQGKIRVVRWLRGGDGPFKPVYGLGGGPDAARPAPLTREQVGKRYRARLQKDRPDVYAARLAYVKHQTRKRRMKAPPIDPMLAWVPRRDQREVA